MCVVLCIISVLNFKSIGYILLCGGIKSHLSTSGIVLSYTSIGVEVVLKSMPGIYILHGLVLTLGFCYVIHLLVVCYYCNGNIIKPLGNMKSESEDTKHFVLFININLLMSLL